MALSGSLSTSSYDGRHYVLSWTASQNISTNKSTISWTLKAAGGDDSWYAERTVKVVIAGTTVYSKSDRVQRYTGTVKTGTITLTHDSAGAKSFSASVEAAVFYSSVNCTGSKSFTLDTIPRQATLTAAPNFNDEANPQITYSNPAGSAVTSLQACISLDGSAADVPYRDISKTGTSYTFSLTDAERNTLRNACTTANSRTVKFYVKTVIGGKTYYSSVSKTLSIVNANPTLTCSAVDTNETTLALTGDSSKWIRYYSTITRTASASGKKGATIKSTTGAGTTKNVNQSSFAFKTTDSRGNVTEKTVTGTLIAYVKLTANYKPKIDVNGNVTIHVKGNYFNGTFGSVKNTLTLQYRYKKGSGSYTSWTSYTPTISGNEHDTNVTFKISSFDYQSNYTFQVKVSDKLATVTPSAYSTNALPVFDWGAEDFNFNVPVNINGNLIVSGTITQNNEPVAIDDDVTVPYTDYVVETGTSGIWTYRKWQSGIAECWGTVAAQAFTISTAWGALYVLDNAIPRQTYPFSFTADPVVSMTLHNPVGNCWAYTGTPGGVSQSPAFGLARGTSGSVTVGARIMATGRWK